MNSNDSCFRFHGQNPQPCQTPEWYAEIMRDADEHGGSIPEIYARNGIHLLQKFGEGLDSVEVYDAGTRGHLVEYWDPNRSLAVIFIDYVGAYLEFRAKYLHPWAWLIAESERIADVDQQKAMEQQRRRT